MVWLHEYDCVGVSIMHQVVVEISSSAMSYPGPYACISIPSEVLYDI